MVNLKIFSLILKMEKVVITDLDGTLIDDNKALEEASFKILGKKLNKSKIRMLEKDKKAKIYNYAQKQLDLLIPKNKVIEFINNLKNQGFYVIVLTARFEDVEKETEKLLNKIGLKYDRLILRKKEESNIDDEIWKKNVIKEYLAKEMIFFEDKPENLELIINYLNKLNNKIKSDFYLVVGDYLFKKI